MKKRDTIISIAVIVLAVAFFGYRYVTDEKPIVEEAVHVGDEVALREISVENFYDVPGKTRHVKYNVFIDGEGRIQKITSDDLNDPTHQTKMDEFSAELIEMVRGEKLSELQELDMVGTSSLTTKSFNAALPELRASI